MKKAILYQNLKVAK